MVKKANNVLVLRSATGTLAGAAGRFLDERDLSPGTRRVYGITLANLGEDLGAHTGLDAVTTDQLRGHLDHRYATTSPATFNRNLATIASFFSWAHRRHLVAEDPSIGLERRRERRTARQADQQRAIALSELEALWNAKAVAVREKTLWHLLYESGARANEVLGLDVGDLDFGERSAIITGKGGHAEKIFWGTATARLLPRLLGDRSTGPVFLTDRAPLRLMAMADLDPVSGRARLSYRRAAELFTQASGGRTLHQLRHSRLAHLAEEGVDVALLKAQEPPPVPQVLGAVREAV